MNKLRLSEKEGQEACLAVDSLLSVSAIGNRIMYALIDGISVCLSVFTAFLRDSVVHHVDFSIN